MNFPSQSKKKINFVGILWNCTVKIWSQIHLRDKWNWKDDWQPRYFIFLSLCYDILGVSVSWVLSRVSRHIQYTYTVLRPHWMWDVETLSINDNEKLAKYNLSIRMCCFHKNPMRCAVTWLRTQFGLKCLMTMLTVVTVLVCHETEPAHDLIGSDQIWIDSSHQWG